jgi:hypothetical protein
MPKVGARFRKILFGLILLVLSFQVSFMLVATSFINWELDQNHVSTLSQVWVNNRDVYGMLTMILKEHNYSFMPWSDNVVAGTVVIYGDIRPMAQLVLQLAGSPISIITREFEPSPQSFGIPWGGPIAVFSTSAAQLGALLWAAALVATAWYVASRRSLSLRASLVIVFVPLLLYVMEVGFVVATGGPAWFALLLTASALAPPALLLLGFAIAKARRA